MGEELCNLFQFLLKAFGSFPKPSRGPTRNRLLRPVLMLLSPVKLWIAPDMLLDQSHYSITPYGPQAGCVFQLAIYAPSSAIVFSFDFLLGVIDPFILCATIVPG